MLVPTKVLYQIKHLYCDIGEEVHGLEQHDSQDRSMTTLLPAAGPCSPAQKKRTSLEIVDAE